MTDALAFLDTPHLRELARAMCILTRIQVVLFRHAFLRAATSSRTDGSLELAYLQRLETTLEELTHTLERVQQPLAL